MARPWEKKAWSLGTGEWRMEEGVLDFLGGDVEVVGQLGEGFGAGR